MQTKPTPAARADGRPLYFDIQEGFRVPCYYALKNGLTGIAFRRGEAVMNDPANSPAGDGSVHTISVAHLPEDAVIFDPITGMCRNKAGTESWREE